MTTRRRPTRTSSIEPGRASRKRERPAAEAVFVVGPRGIIEGVDTGATALLGYATHELVGQHGSQLVLPEDQPVTAMSIDRMRRGELWTAIGRLVRRDRSVVIVEVRARPLAERRIELVVRAI